METVTVLQLLGQLALQQEDECRIDGLAGDIFARHPFAETFGAIVKGHTDNDVVRLRARMGGVPDRLLERNPDLPRRDRLDAHRRTSLRGLMEMLYEVRLMLE